MPDQEKESGKGTWFDDFGPMHDIWIRFERGMQIMLEIAALFGQVKTPLINSIRSGQANRSGLPYSIIDAQTLRTGTPA